jgi:hypothetical protein
MATLQVCYKDANGQLRCYPTSSQTMSLQTTDTVGGKKPDFAQIVDMLRDLLKKEGKESVEPDVVSVLYFAD